MGCGDSKGVKEPKPAAAPRQKPVAAPTSAPAPASKSTDGQNAATENASAAGLLGSGDVRLLYFNARGRAEITRLLFALKNIKYEDVRIDGIEWPDLKPETPYGSMPVLQIGGRTIGQSMAIARFVARELGLTGSSENESAEIDDIVDYSNDLIQHFYPVLTAPDDKKEEVKESKKEAICDIVKRLETIMAKSSSGYVVGSALTWGDLMIYLKTFGVSNIDASWLDECPALKAHLAKIEAIPEIKEWLEKRPVTKF